MLLIGAAFLIGASPAQLSYTIEPAQSEVKAKVRFMALSKKTVTFPKLKGDVKISPGDLSQITLDVEIDASAVQATDAFILDALKGDKFFDVENYPSMRFIGNSLSMSSATKGEVAGQLTARGVTLPQKLMLEFSKPPASANGQDSFIVKGRIKMDRRDYGMTSYALIVGNTVDIRITAQLIPDETD